jgi:hypothetical protein
MPRRRKQRVMLPRRYQTVPARTGHLRRRVYVMERPVRAPMMEATTEGMTRRRPEEVALERRTAWKYRGL